jgi:hypothetical protein
MSFRQKSNFLRKSSKSAICRVRTAYLFGIFCHEAFVKVRGAYPTVG